MDIKIYINIFFIYVRTDQISDYPTKSFTANFKHNQSLILTYLHISLELY